MKKLVSLMLLLTFLLATFTSCQEADFTTLPETLPQTQATASLTEEKITFSPAETTEALQKTTAETEDFSGLACEFLVNANDSELWKQIAEQAEGLANTRVIESLSPPTTPVNGILTIPETHAGYLYMAAFYAKHEYSHATRPSHECPIQGYFQKIEEALKDQEWTDIVFEGDYIYYSNGGFYFVVPEVRSADDELWYFADFGKTVSADLTECNTIRRNAFANCTTLEEISIREYVDLESGALANCKSLKTVRCYPRGYKNPAHYPISMPERQVYGSFGQGTLGMDYASGGPYEGFTSFYEQDFQIMRKERDKAVPCYPTDDVAEHYSVVDGVLVAYYGIGGHIVIPEGVTEIRGGVFDHCKSNVLEVTLPSTLKKICTGAFAGMPMLIELRLPDGLEEIEPLAIYEDIDSIPFIHITNVPENCKVAENAFNDYHPAR